MQIIRNSPKPVHLFEVKSHAGIASNECADAVTKYQATQFDANIADTGMPCAGIKGNPFHNLTWLAYDRDIPSDSISSRPSNLPTRLYPKAHLFLKSLWCSEDTYAL